MVDFLKFQTLFSSLIKCWLSGLELTKFMSEKQIGKTPFSNFESILINASSMLKLTYASFLCYCCLVGMSIFQKKVCLQLSLNMLWQWKGAFYDNCNL